MLFMTASSAARGRGGHHLVTALYFAVVLVLAGLLPWARVVR